MMNYEKIEAYAEAFAAAPRLAELEIRTGTGGVLRLRRSLESAERKPRSSKKPTALPTKTMTTAEMAPETAAPIGTIVTSTLVGVFRAATKVPVNIGDTITENQTLGFVEVMRLSNEVVATVSGVLSDIFVQDGQPVEYGQPLFAIDDTAVEQE